MPEPNEAFFNSQPAAAEIRRLTVLGIGSCLARLHGDEAAETTAELLGATGALQRWDITENMHGKGSDELTPHEAVAHQAMIMSSPRLAAEFVAGQFLTYVQTIENLSGPDRAVLDEHDALDSDERRPADDQQLRMIDMETAPDSVQDYTDQFRMLSMLMHMLDYAGERPHDEALAAGQPYRHPLLDE